MTLFRPVSTSPSFPSLEESILKLWKERKAFERSVEQRPASRPYVFYDGPPFATGLPHYGHFVASTLKDIVPRYWAMRGYRVERRFGWDTHGLPIEMLMEKELGLSGPTSIKAFGVAEFNEACRANVLKYTKEWERVIGRLGRWVDFDNDYKTMEPSFMESVWWVFQQLWEKDLVYQDFRVMPFSWRLSTSLSNFEANLDYRDVQDPAVTVSMPLVGDDRVLLIWTTTPWTLPSNLAIAAGPGLEYAEAKTKDSDTVYVLAKERVSAVLGKGATVLRTFPGEELLGRSYEPLFPYFSGHAPGRAFTVIASGHVTTGDGTGLVHMAPDFGEDDFTACRDQGIQVVQSVDDEGNFKESVTDFAGRNIKEADPDIIRMLKEHGRIFRHATVQHSYPFCWRSGTPLIYKAVPARFIRVERIRERMVELNSGIHWVPGAVGSKRFGNWLADARDWNVSRNRFWGTPIPIWKCTDCGNEECLGSIAELVERSGEEVTDIHPHKIGHIELVCPDCGAPSRLIGDVFDCWFESGAMPYAQDHYPFEGKEAFEAGFPAQFIAEGLDQTRGWFYTLLVLSTALFDSSPFQNVIVNGMVLAEDGSKMSKSKMNFPPPEEVLDELGADAIRAYLINSPIVRAEPLRFKKEGVRDVIRTTLLPLVNSWSFFTQYANIDGWSPSAGLNGLQPPPVEDRPELDRWLLSVLQSLIGEVNEQMEGYYLYKVVPSVLAFIDHLTNWYIRRSRRRFWRSVDDAEGRLDKASAYATLYETLVSFSQVLAPVLPFLSEAIYQQLVVEPGMATPETDSVHLCDFPEPRSGCIDKALEQRVELAREVVSMGRALRERHRLKIRQPLASVTLVHHSGEVREGLAGQAGLIAEELNVKEVLVRASDAELTSLSFKANFKTLGRRYGKQMRAAAQGIESLDRADWDRLQSGETLPLLGQEISAADVIARREAKDEVVIETQDALVVALDTELTEALVYEGHSREAIRRIQQLRKDSGLEIADRIRLRLYSSSQELSSALEQYSSGIADEVLASALEILSVPGGAHSEDINGMPLGIDLQAVR
jgi:isoleucyl-tRNA synthetase